MKERRRWISRNTCIGPAMSRSPERMIRGSLLQYTRPVAEFRLPIVRPMCSWCLFPRLSPPNPQFDGAIRNGLDVRLTDAIFPRSNHYAISERGRPARHGETPRPAASAGVPRRLFKDDVMNCHDRDVGLLWRAGRLPLWLLGALGAVLLVLAGCVT